MAQAPSFRNALPEKLLEYGFQAVGRGYHYRTTILNGDFHLSVLIDQDGRGQTTLTEIASNEEYILYQTNATGAFVAEVRAAVAAVLDDIAAKCCVTTVFKTAQAIQLINAVQQQYGDQLEFLWEKFPTNAVWRRQDNKKWYGLLLTVPRRKLGGDSDEIVEIIDLRSAPENLAGLLKRPNYYPGWHMNKQHWYTIILDGSVPLTEICQRIEESYLLAK
ncbi:MmcQ/YjbR family DNA-binding protein [Lapidilactobacillus achengensis]|uniref:MmcQ/YjbR family DNA-binding protein n=1 Tax=Lapidilactobacillus achengensis TaxID=2486000 RepID=A0ABW1UMY3_9LACO|nr:MmcQ/YjbR family DNA-binding protein [Lapidilactobacillus achengensis]